MLNVIHEALDGLLRSGGQIDPLDVDVSFERPADEWVGSLIRPTVDFFLFDIRENTERRETNLQLQFKNGRAQKRMPARRIDLFYMVSVLTTVVADEHELLWRTLATLLKHEELTDELLPEGLRGLQGGFSGRLATSPDARNLLEIWSAIGARPRPALCYVLTAPLDVALSIESPLVLTRTARTHRMAAAVGAPRVAAHIGGFVRDAAGRPLASVQVSAVGSARVSVTDSEGRYRLHSLAEGPRRLRVERAGFTAREIEVTVPAESYDIVLDG